MNNFASVATDILLANNAVVNKGLTLGKISDTENTAFIRSANKDSLTQGKGFYIENTGKFSFGDSDNYVNWDNSQLSIKGRIGGEISDMTLGELYVSDRLKLTADGIFATDSLGNETFSLFANTGNAVFAGELSAASGTFAGTLAAATGSFSGEITANSGFIGGVTIDENKVYTGTGTYNNTNTPFYFDNTGKFSLKNNFS